ncbi:dTDP-glucose 4,6-dehydratase [Paenibacillus arenilitoris]|uniref:dTDP-glucose 4,6-dehydratase n=1 Tax=Paenibacillus arenilitoris TaxID=2772299 RepID=A0A927H8C2_9BACL|nr:dTDP-glucose 4,6-dehydratase [Paenibacillus arenilitoris]MBD2871533.1 dTDP-glucose 4,6-dehydratase [Paenibacillus arenilitoris]
MKLLITGGAGFIGSNFAHYMVKKYPDYQLINLDALTYAGNTDNLAELNGCPNHRFVHGSICDKQLVENLVQQGVDAVINFAAESHVDRSIAHPEVFVQTNVLGTQLLLEAARKHKVRTFIQISTDEVYGSLGPAGLFTEQTPIAPNSPYSSSKAAGDLLARAYFETYGLQVMITRCSNNYGPYQFPEKLIPHMIISAIADRPLTVYGDGLNVRDWLHVEDHCSAIDLVLHKGTAGEVYNIGGSNERTNISIVSTILEELQKPETLIKYVADRLGHDRRYGIDASKIINELGWKPKYRFETGIRETIRWYLQNDQWWNPIISGQFKLNEVNPNDTDQEQS